MSNLILKNYSRIVEFLAITLGPNYEIALYDTRSQFPKIIALANGNISNLKIGDKLSTDHSFYLDKAKKENLNSSTNFNIYTNKNKRLRSSIFFIRNNKMDIIGILLINFDDTLFLDISNMIISLTHPDELISKKSFKEIDDKYFAKNEVYLSEDITDIAKRIIKLTLESQEKKVSEMTKDDKMNIVSILDKKSVFLLKGSVSLVASSLLISEATLYRYISEK